MDDAAEVIVEPDDSLSRQIVFFPWLRLETTVHVGGVQFVPFRDADGEVAPQLVNANQPLTSILAGYIDRKGGPVGNCVVAVGSDGWNLPETDFSRVSMASSLLFLGCFARNDYFARFLGPYVNSVGFRPVWQRFSGDAVWIALTRRRRDGGGLDGGYRHGEVKFSLPLQCSLRDAAQVDVALLASLDTAIEKGSQTLDRLRLALPFVSLANTDDDLMTIAAEAILMGSAFEQLLAGDGSAFKLGKKFGALLKNFGQATVAEARATRPGIEIDISDPDRAAAQPDWFVHRKWMEELYDVRSRNVHRGTVAGRTWGWHLQEHLLMAAWVFPLAVKLLLEREGSYILTDRDRSHCQAVDKLLAVVDWDEEIRNGSNRWHEIVSATNQHFRFSVAMERMKAAHPELFPASDDSAS